MSVKIAFADSQDDRVRRAVDVLSAGGAISPVLADDVATAAAMTSRGDVDAGVAGSLTSSPDCIRAALKGIGTATPGGFACGCFFMDFGDHVFTYADPAVVPTPTAEQLATIAIEGADAHRRYTGEQPRIAMLSFSTLGSAEHAEVDKVRFATKLVRERRPDLAVDGELQFDVAVDAAVAARKCPDSTVAGHANVFVFPDLNAGNIAYKVTERLAGAKAIGSFVLGLRRPWVDLSRGCSVEDIIDAAKAAARLSTNQLEEAST